MKGVRRGAAPWPWGPLRLCASAPLRPVVATPSESSSPRTYLYATAAGGESVRHSFRLLGWATAKKLSKIV